MPANKAPLPPARHRAIFLFIGLSATWLGGCASLPPASSECRSVELDPAPAWMAGATFDREGERLVLADPGAENLLVFDLEGRFAQKVDLPELDGLDFHHPVRLEAEGEGLLVGDRNRVLRIAGGFDSAETAFAGLEGVNAVHLGDWTRIGGGLGRQAGIVAFADLEVDDETWERGFVRLEPPDDYTVLGAMPLVVGGEYERYYGYGLRPYVARAGRRAYVLRYQKPTTVYAVGRRGLEPLWQIDDGPTRLDGAKPGAERLIGWKGGLYLLERVRLPDVEEEGLEAPQPILPGQPVEGEGASEMPEAVREAMKAAFAAGKVVKRSRSDWYLSRLDTQQGGRIWRRRLVSEHEGGLTVVPGKRAWALIGHQGAPTGEDRRPMRVFFVNGDRVEGAASASDICLGN